MANRLVDKLVVDLADFTMSETSTSKESGPIVSHDIPHNSAVFDMSFWKDDSGHVHADMATPKIHGKYMPSMIVLQCLTDYCIHKDGLCRVDDITIIWCVTELLVNNLHLRANPIKKDGAWFDNVVLRDYVDVHGISSPRVGSLKFIFFFPDLPAEYFAIIHPAYGYHPQHSVLSHMYRMEYEDDPVDILNSAKHIDREDECWILDMETKSMDSCPHLSVVSLATVESHLLMVPYHDHSKFMIGVVDQCLWSNKFVSY